MENAPAEGNGGNEEQTQGAGSRPRHSVAGRGLAANALCHLPWPLCNSLRQEIPGAVVRALPLALAVAVSVSGRAQVPPADGFNPGANDAVNTVAVQADGKILVGGRFFAICGQTRALLARLNADGTLDTGFNPGAGSFLDYPVVNALLVQADGKILVGGNFTMLAGQTRYMIGRLNPDGTLDTAFNPGDGVSGGTHGPIVNAMAIQPDGKILVAGSFSELAGQARANCGRLNADGTRTTRSTPKP